MKLNGAVRRLQFARADRRIRRQVDRVEAWLAEAGAAPRRQAPVLFFNASTRIHHLSLNGAFALLASWAVRRRGAPVRYVVCQAGMEQCVLGTDETDRAKPPPCTLCTRYSRRLFPSERTLDLRQESPPARLAEELEAQDLSGLMRWSYRGLPLGRLCLPGLRWALRRHHLADRPEIQALFRQYLRSAVNVADRFQAILERHRPQTLVVFNGIMFPEAVARAVARSLGVPVVTHEVGLKPYSAFFSHQHATFRQMELPDDLRLSPRQMGDLERYLQQRRRGRFSMAGVRFWPEMRSLPQRIESRLPDFRQLVTVFTNVVFDTSQVHANTLYPHMFAWLEDVAAAAEAHPETFFVIRAHPDEDRPGKASRESVAEWLAARALAQRANVAFIAPAEYVSSYELIERSRFVLVYNSSIGLEASIMGAPVLCAGRARYTQIPTVRFPETARSYRSELGSWLRDGPVGPDAGQVENARAFLFYELNHASLDFSEFLDPYPVIPGMVTFSDFDPQRLERAPALETVWRGILEGAPFLLAGAPVAAAG